MDKINRLTDSQLAANEDSVLLRKQISELMILLTDWEDAYRALQSKHEALARQLKSARKTMNSSRSQIWRMSKLDAN